MAAQMPKKSTRRLIEETLKDNKAQDVRVLDVRGRCDFADYMIVASGTSSRHVQTLAEKIREALIENGRRPLGMEGEDLGEWVLVDAGDTLAHVMRPQTRDFYQLEKLWDVETKPVRRRKAAPPVRSNRVE